MNIIPVIGKIWVIFFISFCPISHSIELQLSTIAYHPYLATFPCQKTRVFLQYFCTSHLLLVFRHNKRRIPPPWYSGEKKVFSLSNYFFPKGKSNTPFWTFFYVRRLPFFLSKTRLANIHFYLRFLFLDLEWETYCLITCLDKTI